MILRNGNGKRGTGREGEGEGKWTGGVETILVEACMLGKLR